MKDIELLKMIKRLEGMVSELSETVKALKASIDRILEVRERESLSLQSDISERASVSRKPIYFPIRDVLWVNERGSNPWARDAALSLLDDRIEKQVIKASFETYRPTLDALKSEPGGLSAEEVAKKTGRKRNTESTYLNRLYRAGLVKKKKQGNKVLYTLGSEENIYQVFGNTG